MLPASAKLLLRRLRPANLGKEAARVWGKAARRLGRIEERRAFLPAAGERRGAVLFSFILDPFLLPPGAPIPYGHTHDWESFAMARCFAELGYDVDVIHWTNRRFEPEKDYALFLDPRLNMERLGPRLGDGCRKVLHIETAHHGFHNAAQRRRLEYLAERRGIVLPPFKMIEENRAIEHADLATLLGNEFTASTYAFAGKELLRVPISAPFTYPFPEDKDFAACRRDFLWFGSGGMVHKGLDLVLDAFAGLPDHHLTVCGPVSRERPFAAAYYRELYQTPNITTVGWVDVGAPEFLEIARRCLGLVYPSCSEGGGGGVITCMHAALVPVVTPEASVDVDGSYGVLLREATVEALREAVRELSARPPERLAAMARGAWEHARAHHTRETFLAAWRDVARRLLTPPPPS